MGTGAPDIFTIGHSTHTLQEIVRLLRRHGIAHLIDVRTAPGSRRMPHFAKSALELSLPAEGIEYGHVPELGGFRRPQRDSTNTGWQTRGFQGYADYMQTAEFERALARLEAAGRASRTAIMCAEGLWWRCHRRLIADALLVRGWTVRHIDPSGALMDHRLPPFASVEQGRKTGRLAYPSPQRSLDL